jgi:hypothetical protein
MDSLAPRRTAAKVIALVAANWALNAACWRFIALIELEYLFLVAIGVPLAQTFLLAAWLSFVDGRWPWRIAVAVLLTAGAAAEIGTGGTTGSVMPAVLLLEAALFAVVALMLPLWRIRGWRLTPDEGAVAGDVGQFRVGDLLLWMAVIGVPLALCGFVNAENYWREDSVRAAMRDVGGRLLLMLLPLHWLAMLAAFAPRRSWHARVYRAGVLLYAGIMIALCTSLFHYMFIVFRPRGWGPSSLLVPLIRFLLAGSPFVIGPLVVWLNCRVLRAFGWRLTRPAWNSHLPPQAERAPSEVATASP